MQDMRLLGLGCRLVQDVWARGEGLEAQREREREREREGRERERQ